MSIWQNPINLEDLNRQNQVNMLKLLDIRVTEYGDDYLIGTMPVDSRTKQPFGLLHGGASCVLAETVGSIAGNYCIDIKKHVAVGMEIRARHVRPVTKGIITAKATLIEKNETHQKWKIPITNQENECVCLVTLHLAVITKDKIPH